MAATKVARKLRRGRTSATRLAAIGAAAATGAALTLSSAPPAGALDVTQEVYTAGALLGLLPVLGIESVTIPLGNIDPVGDVNLTLDFNPVSGSTVDLYNTINALTFSRRSVLSSTYDRVLGAPADPPGQFPAMAGSGGAAGNLVDAYRAQISSVNGNTPPGYTPFQAGAGNTTNATNELFLYLNNPLRPNGGVQARFGPILNLFGVETTVPAAGVNTSTGIKLNAATLDLTWAYSPVADLPVTLNPFSWANSLLAALPTNLLGGVALKGVEDTTALGLNVAGVLGILNRLTLGVYGVPDGKAWYGTLLPNDLPILEPLRLPARLLNAVFGLDLGTPFADALQPALTILVNTGYSDVVTPADIAADPALADKYQPYDRTFLTSGTTETFLSVSPLTPAEWLQVPGDVFKALIIGFRDVFVPPAPPQTPPASVVDPAAATVLSVTPAPVVVAQSVAEVADEPAAEVAVAVQADPTPEPAPGSDVAVAVDPVVESVEAESPEPATSPRKARGSTALSAPAAESSEAAAPRAGAVHRSARQDAGSSAPRRSTVRSAAN
jgi:hypothetical protein